jgi:hypothetical protein
VSGLEDLLADIESLDCPVSDRRLFVLAGNYAQAKRWAHDQQLPRSGWANLTFADTLRGARAIRLVRVGTWQGRRDLEQVEDYLAHLDVVEVSSAGFERL